MMTRASGCNSLMRRVTTAPSSPGSCMSRRTMSGRAAPMRASASSPSPAVPTGSMPSTSWKRCENPSLTTGWSSTMNTRKRTRMYANPAEPTRTASSPRIGVHGAASGAKRNPDRQRPGTAHLPAGPADRRRLGELEDREGAEPRLEGDAQLHPGQVRSGAAVDAEAEGGVAVDLAVDDHLVGPVEGGGVPVGGREREQHELVGLHRTAVPVHVLFDEPGHGHGGVGAEQLLHGDWKQLGLGNEPLPVGRRSGQVPDRGADGAPGGVDAGDQQ